MGGRGRRGRGAAIRRAASAAAGSAALVAALVACGPSPNIPRIEELPPQDDTRDPQAPIGAPQSIPGRVVEQRYEHGEPEETGGGRRIVARAVIVTIARSDITAEIELVVPVGYVEYPPPDTGEAALDLPDGEYIFVVQARPDGRYECATPICISES